MTAPDAAEAVAQRIDELLAELRADPRAAAVAEELTCCLVQLYGDGLARIAALLGPERVGDLCVDPLVESLLLVHDLHPVAADARIRAALERAGRPPGEVDRVDMDGTGVVHLRMAAGGSGCPSSRQTLVGQIEAVVRRAAPEATDVVVEFPVTPPPLLQVSVRPGLGRPAAPLVPAAAGP